MAVVYTIEPNPHWVIIDNFSKLPNGAAIYTFSNKNPSEFKPAFQNEGGLEFGQPIVGFGNGTMPPIFWKFDSDFPDEGYFIKVYSAKIEQNGVLLWTFNNLFGGGTGGGGTVTTNNDIENLLVNGQFFSNIGDQIGAPSIPITITLAPSNHAGFVGYPNLPTDGPVGPDIIFAKSNLSAQDSLTFEDFTPGDDLLDTTPTPEQFVKYRCVVAGTEQFRFVQFPLVKGLQNLNGKNITVKIWANLQSGNPNITLSLRQFFGNGGVPSPDVVTPIGSLDLVVGSWEQTIFSSVLIPSVGGKNFGTCGNDALYLQLNLVPTNVIDIEFILPGVFLTSIIFPEDFIDFNTLDRVEAITNNPRTGDIRTSVNAFTPYGWLNMNDGTIGSAASTATARANVDTFPLYDLIWRTFQPNQALAPMSGGAYGVNSFTDFDANRTLTLTRNLGRVMAGALPTQITRGFTTPVANTLTVSSTTGFILGAPVTVSASTVPALVNGTTYYARILTGTTMSLHISAEGAIANTGIVLFPANAGLGGNVIIAAHALGSFLGEETHLQTAAEVGPHTHPANLWVNGGSAHPHIPVAVSPVNGDPDGSVIDVLANANGARFNVMQPTVFMNVFIKL